MENNNFYSENVKNMVNNLISTAYFNSIKAIENLYHVWRRAELTKIKYEDYVENEFKSFSEDYSECPFDTHHWDIVNWIVNQTELEILDFQNANGENETAMALLDAALCKKYYEDLKKAKSWF